MLKFVRLFQPFGKQEHLPILSSARREEEGRQHDRIDNTP